MWALICERCQGRKYKVGFYITSAEGFTQSEPMPILECLVCHTKFFLDRGNGTIYEVGDWWNKAKMVEVGNIRRTI